MVSYLTKVFAGRQVKVSRKYPQTRYNPSSTEVAVYIDIY